MIAKAQRTVCACCEVASYGMHNMIADICTDVVSNSTVHERLVQPLKCLGDSTEINSSRPTECHAHVRITS